MSITSWKTYASGDTLTASDMNTYQRDNGRWLSHNSTGGAPMARVFDSAGVANFTSGNKVPFDSETFDLGGMHDTVTNNSRLTAPSGGGGKYLIGCSIRTDFVGTPTNGTVTTYLRHQDTTRIAAHAESNIDVVAAHVHSPSAIYALAATEYVEVEITHGLGGASQLDVTASARFGADFWAIWLGE